MSDTFAKRLKDLRKEKELTQIEFAKKFNIANGTVGNWESGNRRPDYETLQKIADFFSVSIDYLLNGNNNEENIGAYEEMGHQKNNLYKMIDFLCKKNNITGGKLCTDTGVSKGLLTDLKMGRRTGVSAVTANKIATYFGVTVDYLLNGEVEEECEDEVTLYERIVKLCQKRGVKGGKMCADLGMSKSTLTNLKMERQAGLSAKTLQRIASYLGVSVDYLLSGENDDGDVYTISLYDRITNLCKQKGVSGSRMCSELGLSKSTLSDMKSGRKKGFNAETAHKIATYLNVSVGYLLAGEDENEEKSTRYDGVSEKRKALIEFVLSVPEDKVGLILRVTKSIVEYE